MNSLDLDVLQCAEAWLTAGHQVHLFTVVSTWGSAPRLPGALLAMREDGYYVGSVSGGCIEEDLADKARQKALPSTPNLLEYGVSQDDAMRTGIPCGGRLRVFVEPLFKNQLDDTAHLNTLINAMMAGKLTKRAVHIRSGEVKLTEALPGSAASLDGEWFYSYFGPKWRLLIIGANQLSHVLATMAPALEFEVTVCDPRPDMRAMWSLPAVNVVADMPDDVVIAMRPDIHTAIIAVTHDPKLDDMALLEALKCEAFYVGALGAVKNQAKRRERLRMFDLTEMEIAKLHGPVGLNIGSRTPAEIAVAILAGLIHERTQLRLSAQPQDFSALRTHACTTDE